MAVKIFLLIKTALHLNQWATFYLPRFILFKRKIYFAKIKSEALLSETLRLFILDATIT